MISTPNNFSLLHWRNFGCQFIGLGFVALLLSSVAMPEDMYMHTAFCVIGLLLVMLNLKPLRGSDLSRVLVDHRILLTISFSLYFLLGALVASTLSNENFDIVFYRYRIGADDALYIDAINAIGMGLALFFSAIYRPKFLPKLAKSATRKSVKFDNFFIIPIFLAVGGSSFIYVQLNDWIFGEMISGSFRMLANLLLLCILMGMMFKGRHAILVWWLSAALAIVMSFFGLLGFQKFAMLLPIMVFFVGWGIRINSLRHFIGGFILVAILFNIVGGPIQFARITFSDIDNQSISERLSLFRAGLQAAEELDVRSNYVAVARFNYMHEQAGAIDFYNSGDGGSDWAKIPWVFIPRFVYPNKPSTTSSGIELYYKMTGMEGTSYAAGIFGDGYYNAGWIGVVFWSIIGGLVIAQNSAIASVIISSKSLIFFPIVLLSLIIAFRIDGTLLADYLGIFMYGAYFLIFMNILYVGINLILSKHRL